MSALEIKPGRMYEQRDGRTVAVSRRPDVVQASNYPLICSLGVIRDRFGRAFQASPGPNETDLVKCLDDESHKADFTAEFLSLAWRSRVEALEAKIARLEAENESLSRQLRSRERNKEPASAGKVWRWSPMV